MKCTVIIPAAGSGKRLGGTTPKQYIRLSGVPIIIHTLRIFEEIDEIDKIIIAVSRDRVSFVEQLITDFEIGKPVYTIIGGVERQDSVNKAFTIKWAIESDIILIHDAVCPFASKKLVREIISATEMNGAAIPVIVPKETIKRLDIFGNIHETINRDTLGLAQTPQGFKTGILIKTYKNAYNDNFKATDDASILEHSNIYPKTIAGEETNIKITSPFDLKIAEMIHYDLRKA